MFNIDEVVFLVEGPIAWMSDGREGRVTFKDLQVSSMKPTAEDESKQISVLA